MRISELIRSKDNNQIKYFALMHDRKKASKEGVIFIEGVRLCEDAIISGVIPEKIVCTEDRLDTVKSWEMLNSTDVQVTLTTKECFAKIASTVNPQGVAMIVREPEVKATIPSRGDKDVFVVLEEIQDPGNLGTIIRMADAFDFTAVIITEGTVDPYNEKVLRSSMGSIWHIPVIKFKNSDEIITTLKARGVSLIATDLNGKLLDEKNLTLPAAYFIGNEGNGLRNETSDACDCKIKIPMPGKAESLNAASAASIVGFVLSRLK